jgi:hypothetical protein
MDYESKCLVEKIMLVVGLKGLVANHKVSLSLSLRETLETAVRREGRFM